MLFLPLSERMRDHSRQKWVGQVAGGCSRSCGLSVMATSQRAHSGLRQCGRLALRTPGQGEIGTTAQAHIGLTQTRTASQATRKQLHALHHCSR
jgi:hypothetical protein